ncbi:MAG: GNAT family N-acetyltransferase [Solirubrobacteraceae bacterium]
MFVTLRNGESARIRPIRPDDKPRLERGFARLSDESIRRRFLAPKDHLSQADLAYLTEVDGRDHVALVAVLDSAPDGLAGVGRFIRDPEHPDQAEFAIVVADDLHGHGLGSALAERLAAEARARGIRRFTATVLADNEAVRRLVSRISAGLRQGHVANGVGELVVDLAA